MFYYFRQAHCLELDWKFYEIIRFKGDTPFTILIENYSRVGHRQFFSDIFISKEWDLGRNLIPSDDVIFLMELWDLFGLKKEYGPFTPFYIRSPPNPKSKPQVYRRTIEQVWDQKINTNPSITSKLCLDFINKEKQV
jgi:hypothetical protein